MKLTLSVEELQTALGKLKGDVALNLALDLSRVKPDEITRLATVDSKLIAELLSGHRKEFSGFLSSFIAGDFQKANAILKQLGGTEDDFLKAGGGGVGLVILLVAVVLLYSRPAK
jgi:hypothetical protein